MKFLYGILLVTLVLVACGETTMKNPIVVFETTNDQLNQTLIRDYVVPRTVPSKRQLRSRYTRLLMKGTVSVTPLAT